MMSSGDTIAAVATAPGRGGIAVIRVSGPDAFAISERLSGRVAAPGRIVHSLVRNAAGAVLDECVLLAFRGPASYTGEDVVEIQCHGGTVTPRRILEACFAAGARMARRGEFTERALLNGRLDYGQSESVLALIDAKTERGADAALAGLAGRRRTERRALYEAALGLSAELEHALDIDETELPDGFLDGVNVRLAALRREILLAMRRAREGRMLRDGALVVLAGPPNAGKSSLMNALLRENRAIVSETAGTTRDSIEEWLDLDGWPIRLTDTAGLRESDDALEREGVRRARALVDAAELVIDFGGTLALDKAIAIHAKCDLGRGEGLNVSAVTGEGMEELKRTIVARLEARAASADEAPGDGDELAEVLAMVPETAAEPVLAANAVRSAAVRLGELVGEEYSADLLDRLFSKFCVGK